MSARLKWGPYLVLWTVLAGLQVAALYQMVVAQPATLAEADGSPLAGALSGSAPLALAIFVLQLLKVPLVAARANDLGRPPDDAILAMVPLANLGLWGQLNAGTPTEERRARLRAQWAGDLSATRVFLQGLIVVGRSFPVVLLIAAPLSLLYSVGNLALIDLLGWVETAPEDQALVATQGMWAATIFLAVYTAFQFYKRGRASRLSWIPSLLLLPSALMLGGFELVLAGGAQSAGPALLVPPMLSAGLLWSAFAGGISSVAWVALADLHHRGQWPGTVRGLGAAVRKMGEHGDVIAPHGAAITAAQIGGQFVIPGIHFALLYAFVDMVAMFEPSRPALARSADLTRGIRRRLFKVFYLTMVLYAVLGAAIGIPIFGLATMYAGMFDPAALPWWMWWILDGIWMLGIAVARTGLLWVYRERRALEGGLESPPVAASETAAPSDLAAKSGAIGGAVPVSDFSSYDDVPFFRRWGFFLFLFLCFTPLVIPIGLTGAVYQIGGDGVVHKIPDGWRLMAVGVAAVLLLIGIVRILGQFG
jgi:hypothetical protein